MIVEKPDGVIELGESACCCLPGARRKGMHTNCSTSWWRTNGGDWVRDERSRSTRILAGAANTVEEFIAAMSPNDGQTRRTHSDYFI